MSLAFSEGKRPAICPSCSRPSNARGAGPAANGHLSYMTRLGGRAQRDIRRALIDASMLTGVGVRTSVERSGGRLTKWRCALGGAGPTWCGLPDAYRRWRRAAIF
jgi:hypothetical protein